jgi:MoaA/NifB/PqqE/SkfB family radical SAM enzyme
MAGTAQLFDPPKQLRRLQIEVTTLCNLFCEECSRTVGLKQGTWNDSHMSLAKFRTVVANMPPAKILVLQGVGEPTLNPDLIDITRYARETGRFELITLNTNAVTRTVDFHKELKQAGLDYVCVSVDSFNPEIAERCRSGTKVAKLRRMLRGIYEAYGHIVISMVASRMNMYDIPNTLAELNAMGAELFPSRKFVVEIQPVIDYKDHTSNAPSAAFDREELTQLQSILAVVQRSLPRISVQLNVNSIQQPAPRERCARPFFSPYVTVDGFLTPCCTTADPAIYKHTNMFYNSLDEVWTGDVIRGWLLDYLRNGNEICNGCCFDIGGMLRSDASQAKAS